MYAVFILREKKTHQKNNNKQLNASRKSKKICVHCVKFAARTLTITFNNLISLYLILLFL